MFTRSRYPTRLLVRCPHCHQYASVTRDAWVARQTFCSFDGSPMVVTAIASGRYDETKGDWPHLVKPRPMSLAEAGLPPLSVIARCPCVAETSEELALA